MTNLHDFTATSLSGQEVDLAQYKGKAVLVVNTASKCGFTPQYEGLEKLYEQYGDQGLVVLGFPCDQFGHQEPGDETEIEEFCHRYGIDYLRTSTAFPFEDLVLKYMRQNGMIK